MTDRDSWILDRRPARIPRDLYEPYSCFVENERSADGEVVPVATIFLTNRECPFRCVMCDLWRNTLEESVPAGAIPEQIESALKQLPKAHAIKLYNSGSFFDPRAILVEDYSAIAAHVQKFGRVVVECHPAFLGDRCVHFKELLTGRLEIAMGLETAHPTVLEKLNKRMDLDQFAAGADFLRRNDIDLRVFVLVQPPFMKPDESACWAERSIDFAFDCGAVAVTLIPTRGGNGAMETLAEGGEFVVPSLGALEGAMNYGLARKRGLVFTDLWDVKGNNEDECCFKARVDRLRRMNLSQEIAETVACVGCGRRN